jgi:hypothetical protein
MTSALRGSMTGCIRHPSFVIGHAELRDAEPHR